MSQPRPPTQHSMNDPFGALWGRSSVRSKLSTTLIYTFFTAINSYGKKLWVLHASNQNANQISTAFTH
jgi:hypothetical protein